MPRRVPPAKVPYTSAVHSNSHWPQPLHASPSTTGWPSTKASASKAQESSQTVQPWK